MKSPSIIWAIRSTYNTLHTCLMLSSSAITLVMVIQCTISWNSISVTIFQAESITHSAQLGRRYNHKSYVLPCPSDHLAPRWSAEHTFINHKELLSQYLLDCWCSLLFNIRCGVLSGYYCNKSRAPRKMQSARLSILLSCALCPAPLILGMVSSHGTLRVVVVVVVFLILFCY